MRWLVWALVLVAVCGATLSPTPRGFSTFKYDIRFRVRNDVPQREVDWVRWLLISIVFLLLMGLCVSSFVFWSRRADWPISGSGAPWVALITPCVFAVRLVSVVFIETFGDGLEDGPAYLRRIPDSYAHLIAALLYLCRVGQLYCSYQVAEKAAELAAGTIQDSVGLRAWFLKYRNRAKGATAIKIIAPVVALQTVAIFTTLALQGPKRFASSSLSTTVCLPISLCVLAVAAVLSCKMKSFADDGFLVRKEMRYTGWFILVVAVGFLTIVRFFCQHLADVNPGPGWDRAMDLVIFGFIWCGAHLHPIYASFAAVRQAKLTAETITLSVILETPAYREAFRAFLKQEFSEENLAFLLDVRGFEAQYATHVSESHQPASFSHPQGGLLEAMTRIINLYIDVDASLSVNISSAVQKSTIAQFREGSEDPLLFHPAYEEVVALTHRDKVKRFTRTPSFLALAKWAKPTASDTPTSTAFVAV